MLNALLSKLKIARGIIVLPAIRGPLAGQTRPVLVGRENKHLKIKCKGGCRSLMAEAGCPLQLPPPPQLQRDLFCETLQLTALRIPKRDCHKYMKLLAGYVLCSGQHN